MTANDPTDPSERPAPEEAPTAAEEPTNDIDADLEQLHDPDLGDALRTLLASDDDVRSRARASVDRTLHARSVTSALVDIAGSGLATMRHLLTNPPPPADRERGNRDHGSRQMTESANPGPRRPGTGARP